MKNRFSKSKSSLFVILGAAILSVTSIQFAMWIPEMQGDQSGMTGTLLLSGIQTSSLWILSGLAVVAGAAFGALYFTSKRI